LTSHFKNFEPLRSVAVLLHMSVPLIRVSKPKVELAMAGTADRLCQERARVVLTMPFNPSGGRLTHRALSGFRDQAEPLGDGAYLPSANAILSREPVIRLEHRPSPIGQGNLSVRDELLDLSLKLEVVHQPITEETAWLASGTEGFSYPSFSHKLDDTFCAICPMWSD
jgi:hypothetical protein